MLIPRIITAIFLVAFVLGGLFWLPADTYPLFAAAIILPALWEWSRLSAFALPAQVGYGLLSALMMAAVAKTGAQPGAGLHGMVLVMWFVVAPAWLARRWVLQDKLHATFVGWLLLLPAYFADDDHPQMEKYVVKPIFSREGANVSIIENGKTIEAAEGPYGEEGMIVQQFHPLPKFGDSYMLIGSWLVNDQPAGIGIREDRALITQDMSRFYPHIFVE